MALVDISLYLLTGCFAGFAAGLLGVGGGLIIVPVLYMILSSQAAYPEHGMHIALATSLATICLTSLSSTYAHHKRKAVIWPIFLLITPGICLGAWLGGAFASQLSSDALRPAFGVFELLIAFHLLKKVNLSQHARSLGRGIAFIGGNVIGFISSILGIGGGTLTVPFLHWHNLPMKNAVAVSAACGFPIALFGTASYIYSGWYATGLSSYTIGYVYLPAFILIALTSVTCAPLGARAAHILPEDKLRKIFALLLLILGLRMLVLS